MYSKCLRCGGELTTGDFDGICTACRNNYTMEKPMAERTCETCGNKGARPCADCIRGSGMRDNWIPKGDIESRPTAQDADTLQPAIDKALSYFEKLSSSGQTIQIDGPEFHGLILWSTWNRRPSLPMSAEVEKAIEMLETGIDVLFNGTFATQDSALSKWRDDMKTTVAALKARG
jgi:hypothetical protein